MSVSPELQARVVTVDVRGLPRPQGSMRSHVTANGKVATRYGPEVWRWRHQVQYAVAALEAEPFTGPVRVLLGFDLPRLASHYLPVNRKRSARELRADAPVWVMTMPDIDKLSRCVLDAITDAGLWRDDAQVVQLTAAKRYHEQPGVKIAVSEV